MSKINQSPFGGVSGGFGNLVGSSWKGIPYIRVKPAVYHDAKSEVQLKNRSRFSGCSKLSKSLKSAIIRPVWDCRAIHMSGHNLFISKNSSVFDKNGEIASYEKLILTLGDLPLPENISVQTNPDMPGEIQLSWDDNTGKGDATPGDKLNLVTVEKGEASLLRDLTATRSSQSATVLLPNTKEKVAHLFLFFKNEQIDLYSESCYQMVQF